MKKKAGTLEELYRRFNKKRYVSPDPLQFLYDYPNVEDREIAGLIAASLAYGRVAQILKSVAAVLAEMKQGPFVFLSDTSDRKVRSTFSGFKHRFTTGDDLSSMLSGVKRLIKQYGSLNAAFVKGAGKGDQTVIPALQHFVDELDCSDNYLLPSPSRGSGCKRLNLYLRWMVRKDAVDPGGWKGVPRSRLIIPLDTHMAGIAARHRLTKRKTADMKMALEITDAFRTIVPSDPVKYDFVLTRFGIRAEMNMKELDAHFD